MSYIISTHNLCKEYKKNSALWRRSKSKAVLTNINLNIANGESFALLGPNGSGKTTLIKIFCGLILPTSGSVFIDGLDAVKHTKRAVMSSGFCLDSERSFYYRLSGRRNLYFFASLNKLKPPAAYKKVEELIDELGIYDFIDRPFMQYSSGQKQKLSLARALLANPKIIFLDEPTKSLDASALKSFWQLIGKIQKSRMLTVFVATHNLNEVEDFCSNTAFISKGQIIARGRLESLLYDSGCNRLSELYNTIFAEEDNE